MNELFEIPVCESPRLKWMKLHDVKTRYYPGIEIGDEDEFGNDLYPWMADTSHGVAPDRESVTVWSRGGATEQEAIVALAIWQKWRLWNEPA